MKRQISNKLFNLSTDLRYYSDAIRHMIDENETAENVLQYIRANLMTIVDDIEEGYYTEEEYND